MSRQKRSIAYFTWFTNSSTARKLWTSLLILPNSMALLRAEEALATVFIKVSLGDGYSVTFYKLMSPNPE